MGGEDVGAEVRKVEVKRDYEIIAWKWMRYSGILLIPLVWIHVALNDVIIGVHDIDIDLVAMRWEVIGWRIYSFSILAFAMAHGMNGLRQVLNDYIGTDRNRCRIAWVLFLVWLVVSAIGAIAIIGGVRIQEV
jgi:succinate dehydrogenase / fumarate reductase, membrane anchor subunit